MLEKLFLRVFLSLRGVEVAIDSCCTVSQVKLDPAHNATMASAQRTLTTDYHGS